MASNPPAPEAPFKPSDTFAYGAGHTDEGPFEEWNPTAESLRPVRGRHRVSKQRGGGLARSSTVLGVGVIRRLARLARGTPKRYHPPLSTEHPPDG